MFVSVFQVVWAVAETREVGHLVLGWGRLAHLPQPHTVSLRRVLALR